MKKIYRRDKHNFFDTLVAFLVSQASYPIAFRAQINDSSIGYSSNKKIGFAGSQNVTNIALSLKPKDLMELIATDGWPDSIELETHDLDSNQRPKKFPKLPDNKLTGLHGLINSTVVPMFVDYYESNIDKVRNKFGHDSSKWPTIWDFARVIRNAFAHGGDIYINNPNSQPVQWKGLSYSAKDNGRQVLFNDMGIADVIILLEELDEKI